MLKLFEIKLYGWSPKVFEKRINNHREGFFASYEWPKKQIEQVYSDWYGKKNSYHNYSIGFLEVLYDGSSLCYKAQIMIRKQYKNKEIQKSLNEIDMNKTLTEKEKILRKNVVAASYSLIPYKPRLFAEKKKYMSDFHIEGRYTRVFGLSNTEIVEAIKKDIAIIKKDDFFKNVYFDLSWFKQIAPYVDYTKLFEQYDKHNFV